MRSLGLVLLFLAASPAAAGELQLALRREAVVAGARLRVADLARVRGEAKLAHEVGALVVGYSPRAGQVLRVEAADLRSVLARLRPGLETSFAGAARTIVRRGPLEALGMARIRDVAAQALDVFLGARYARHEAQPLHGEARPVRVPPGALELRARTPAPVERGGRITVWVDVRVDGRPYQEIPVRFSVRAFAPALVAKAPLAAGERLASSQFVVSEREVAASGLAPLPPGEPLQAVRLKRALPAGAVLARDDVEQAPAVSQGGELAVRVASGSIELETVALATRDARPGEIIPVRRPNSRRTFPARVLAAGLAEALWR